MTIPIPDDPLQVDPAHRQTLYAALADHITSLTRFAHAVLVLNQCGECLYREVIARQQAGWRIRRDGDSLSVSLMADTISESHWWLFDLDADDGESLRETDSFGTDFAEVWGTDVTDSHTQALLHAAFLFTEGEPFA